MKAYPGPTPLLSSPIPTLRPSQGRDPIGQLQLEI